MHQKLWYEMKCLLTIHTFDISTKKMYVPVPRKRLSILLFYSSHFTSGKESVECQP